MKSLYWVILLLGLRCVANPLYISPGTRLGGTGASNDPIQIGSAEMFDAVLMQLDRETNWSELRLGEGVFETKGAWNYPIYSAMTRPLVIKGAGMFRTTLRLSTNAVTQTGGADRPDLIAMRLGVPFVNNAGPFVIEDLTIDGNQARFGTNRIISGGLVVHANNTTVRRVRVINLRGHHARGIESFGILINNFTNGFAGPDGNNIIEECLVESNGDVEEYVSPLYIGTEDFGRPVVMSYLRKNRVIGTGRKPTRLGLSMQSHTTIEDNYVYNVEHGLYNDVRPMTNIIARRNYFTGLSYSGVWIILDAPKNNILVEDSTFQYAATNDWIGLTVWDKGSTGAWAKDITLRNSYFFGLGGRPFAPFSGRGNMTNIFFIDNRIPATNSTPTNIPATVIIRML